MKNEPKTSTDLPVYDGNPSPQHEGEAEMKKANDFIKYSIRRSSSDALEYFTGCIIRYFN